MCVEYVYAPSTFSRYLYDQQLCIECELGYIVSKNYKSCIEFRFQLSHLQYANCKRLAQDGLCAEALDGIQLLPNNQYTMVKDQKFLERCAIVNESETECLFPRFGFILDTITKNIFKDTFKTFCALFDSQFQKCQQFQQGFYSYFQTQQGIYLGENFVNPDQISMFSHLIQCKDNYIYIERYYDKLVGCFKQEQILEKENFRCSYSYALKDDKSKCQVIIPFCQEYFEIQGKELCSKCFPFYKLHLQSCIKMSGCLIISRKNPNQCLSCNIESILINGECIMQNQRHLFSQQNLHDKRQKLLKIQQNHQNDSQNLFNYTSLGIRINQNKIIQNSYNQLFLKQRLIEFKKKQLQNEEDFQNNQIKAFSQPILLKQPSEQFDQTKMNNQCIFNNEKKCIYCIDYGSYYVNEQRNECSIRILSIYCEHQAYNIDACLSLQCQINSAINQNLIENFDLKNVMVLNYLKHLSEIFLGSENIMTDTEKEKKNKQYQFYGIDFGKQDQICVNFFYKLEKNEKIFNNYNYFECEKNIISRQDFPYLIYKCLYNNSNLEIKDISFEKCTKYNNEHSFCLECEQGFYFSSKTMKCEQNIQNCIIHSIQNTCILCQSGYNLVKGSRCEAICGISIPGSVNRFHSFFTYKNLDSDFTICKETKIPCKQFINDKCIECFEGYYIDYSSDNNCFIDSQFPDCKIVNNVFYVKKDMSYFKDYAFVKLKNV
ncbi:DHHC zinc finger protein, putative (macronuclear) [Tetrahymena thermophila SB210]|uniref:DHHC zinc finger protein, putative n=1 Tax=Tetrahymena thermophila (strain SB210) TaxID=312017 RepID=W7WXV2_TETTS|nr:DHHC zinc finger protein, putative [Tetrahymena thermophila SB210]EWS71670.1 DHHC zinc finger protein, putative [Tetrahymena thermophila SB210]|eukprot:XP_012655781.1 DHHC zinc finger protein, putative [Tetrahymena thermophila SB210]